jgi:hypothetical protein
MTPCETLGISFVLLVVALPAVLLFFFRALRYTN